MNVDLGIWGKLTRVCVVLLLLTVVAGVLAWYLPLIKQNERMRKTKWALENQVQKELATQKEVQRAIKSLEENPKTVERMAREKLGYAKTNETVVRFEAPAGASGRIQ
jgi:cell division protein FtsB